MMLKNPALKRYCVACGNAFLARRKTAIYCSTTCRCRDYRQRQKLKGKPNARSTKCVATQNKVPFVVTCIECNAKMWLHSRNHHKLYCSRACQQRAYLARKAQKVNVRVVYAAHEQAAR